MKKNVLVFPCGSEIALELYRSLHPSIHFRLFGASSIDDHGKFVYENYIGNVPFYTEENFIPVMQEIVKQNAIDYIIPAMDSVITRLKENEEKLACKVIASCTETTKICLSKKKTYEVLKDVVRVPKMFNKEEDIPYPVFCKPEVGYSAKNTKYIIDRAMLQQHLQEHPECLILEYLPGEEYTLDCFTDAAGKLLFCGPRIRKRIDSGISVNTVPVEETGEFSEIADRINQKIKLQGAWFIQLKRAQNGELVLMEIASRMGGSSSLYRARGINFAQLSLFDAMGIPVEILDNGYPVELDRALGTSYKIDIEYDEIFIDWDDTIILDACYYNPDVIKFLYLSQNRKKKITLLSSHAGDLDQEIDRFQLRQLFDRIIHISKSENKVDFIDNNKAIFIDDAFSERKKVFHGKHIPVFSVDMVEILF
ncbi:MAG: ATP-grasp domain-containing protein [Lachnospiraceae bacterium]|nr:ATP-grasp domain-containing protein [Lachnospiraceae bacterium]